jgi:phosphoribosyl-dephospho-CoA transferase
MTRLARNHLVWIEEAAWQEVVARVTDEQAREIVAHWRKQHLPLVVSSQPAGIVAGRVALGLPAPRCWSRRRLAFDVALSAICEHGPFPTLRQATRQYRWPGAAVELDHALVSLGGAAYVYGSHGWQLLTGLAYLHEGSDIDLCIEVSDFETACAVVPHLQRVELDRRVDGELVFPEGSAVAWREFSQVLVRRTGEVLVKRLEGPRLVGVDVLRRETAPGVAIRNRAASTAVS